MICNLLIFIGVLCFLIQLYYWLNFGVFYNRKGFGQVEPVLKGKSVSVIVTIQNDVSSFRKNLPYITNQNYPDAELLIVYDGTSDEEFQQLQEFINEYGSIRLIRNEQAKLNSGKRAALALGVEAAQGDYVLFTDADCRPGSSNWISLMLGGLTSSEIDVVIGISPYTKDEGLLNRFIQYETLQSASLMIGFLNLGKPYMGLGRNVLFRKSALTDSSVLDYAPLISGDDDLTVNQIANGKNTTWVKGSDAYVYTRNKKNFKEYIHQKRRHFSAGKYYKKEDRRRLGILALSHSFFLLVILLLIILYPSVSTWAIALFLARAILVVGMLQSNSKLFTMPIAWCWIVVFDLFLPFYYLLFSGYIFIKDIKRW